MTVILALIFAPKPWWLRLFTLPFQWATIFPRIYHPADVNPQAWPNLIAHENTHLQQQEAMGVARWLVRYLFDRRFRFRQEIQAMRVELAATAPAQRESVARDYARLLATSYKGATFTPAAPSEDEAYRALMSPEAL